MNKSGIKYFDFKTTPKRGTKVTAKDGMIECYEQPRHILRFGEIKQKQMQLFKDMDVPPPSSLH